MAVRTYLPTLLRMLGVVCKFIARHRTRIVEVIGPANESKLDALVTACDVFTTAAVAFLDTGT